MMNEENLNTKEVDGQIIFNAKGAFLLSYKSWLEDENISGLFIINRAIGIARSKGYVGEIHLKSTLDKADGKSKEVLDELFSFISSEDFFLSCMGATPRNIPDAVNKIWARKLCDSKASREMLHDTLVRRFNAQELTYAEWILDCYLEVCLSGEDHELYAFCCLVATWLYEMGYQLSDWPSQRDIH